MTEDTGPYISLWAEVIMLARRDAAFLASFPDNPTKAQVQRLKMIDQHPCPAQFLEKLGVKNA